MNKLPIILGLYAVFLSTSWASDEALASAAGVTTPAGVLAEVQYDGVAGNADVKDSLVIEPKWIEAPSWERPTTIDAIRSGQPTLMQQVGCAYHTRSGTAGKQRFNQRKIARLLQAVSECTDPNQIKETHAYLQRRLMYRPAWDHGVNTLEKARIWDGVQSDFDFLETLRTLIQEKFLALSETDKLSAIHASGADLPWGMEGSNNFRRVQAPQDARDRKFAVLVIDTHALPLRTSAADSWCTDYKNQTAENIPQMRTVIEHANSIGVQVVEVVYEPDYYKQQLQIKDATHPDLGVLRQDSWLTVDKFRFSAFFGTDLHDELMTRGITDLIVMGFNKIACVKQTALSAEALGYKVHSSDDILVYAGKWPPFPDEYWDDASVTRLLPSFRHLPIFSQE